MRRNPKPLKILIHPDLADTAEVKELVRKGHVVNNHDDVLPMYDLVIGHNCFRISKETITLSDLAVKAARDMKYPPKSKKEKKDEGSLAEA